MNIDDIRYWRTTGGEEIDFVLQEKIAFEARYRLAGFFRRKYATFLKRYPDIALNAISYVVDEEEKQDHWRVWMI